MENTNLQIPEDALSYIAPIGEFVPYTFDVNCLSPNHPDPWPFHVTLLAVTSAFPLIAKSNGKGCRTASRPTSPHFISSLTT